MMAAGDRRDAASAACGSVPGRAEAPPAGDPARYLDREASELEYHARVLSAAGDPRHPLLERARFCGFFTTLTDEFFRVRIAALKEQEGAGDVEVSRGGHSAREQIRRLERRYRGLAREQRRTWEEEIAPALAEARIRIVGWADLDRPEREGLEAVFEERIFPVLTPLAIGPTHPFPFISDLSLSIGVLLDAGDGGPQFARVKVPPLLDRLVRVEGGASDAIRLVRLEDIIGAHLDRLFPGRTVSGWNLFRVTRNADYDVEDVGDTNLVDVLVSEINERRFGRVVRLELDERVPGHIRELLQDELRVGDDEVVVTPGPLDLGMLRELHHLERPDLKRPPWQPVDVGAIRPGHAFERLRGGDLLVQHPYDSFARTTQRFIEMAAEDPRVLAIKQTLYRTSGDSPIVHALIRAAALGKQVAALVELKARFDERANIGWARMLEEAGVHVVYGFVDLKTHTKTALVVREDEDGEIRRYGHIGTGNYNPNTARVYEDLGLFTANPALTADLNGLFNMLTGHSRELHPERLLVAPTTLRPRLLELIRSQACAGGRIVAKVNHLSHTEIIDALYAAAQAGADIDLIVRTTCCLRPGISGLSENIRVKSVVGPFLEHSRVYRFGREPDRCVYLIGSADLMPRNLDNRVEAVTPVEAPALRARLEEILDLLLADEALSWRLDADGTWRKTAGRTDAQQRLCDLALERARCGTGTSA